MKHPLDLNQVNLRPRSYKQVISGEKDTWGQLGLQPHLHSMYLKGTIYNVVGVGGGGRWFLPGTPLLAAQPPVLQASHGGERGVNLRDTNWDEGLSPGVWVARQCGMVQPPEGPPLFCGSRGLTCQTTDVRYRSGGRRQGPPWGCRGICGLPPGIQ